MALNQCPIKFQKIKESEIQYFQTQIQKLCPWRMFFGRLRFYKTRKVSILEFAEKNYPAVSNNSLVQK